MEIFPIFIFPVAIIEKAGYFHELFLQRVLNTHKTERNLNFHFFYRCIPFDKIAVFTVPKRKKDDFLTLIYRLIL